MVYNPYIVVPIATWAVAQVSKFAIAAIKGDVDFRYLYASGGMPSVHASVVMSLATTSFLVDGPSSPIFGVVLVFALIVMYDSFGVRRSTGELAVAVNSLLDNLDRNRFKLDGPTPHRLREILGHQPREVGAGAITGIVLAGLFNYDRLGWLGTFLQTIPAKYELWSYMTFFGVMVVAGAITRWILAKRYPKSKVMKRFRGHIFTASQTIGWLGLVTTVFVYEHASYLAWRLWPLLAVAGALIWAWWILTGSAREVPAGLAAEADHTRKMKWLNFGRKSRTK